LLSKFGEGVIMQGDDLLTIEEAAEYLKLSKRTTWRWCRSGRLPAFKIGHQWRISKAELQELISAKKRRNRVASL
jgi:excisionase family DNA binding protein